jgi:hypothetical protein
MSDQFWLTKAQLKRIEPVFPRTRGIPRPACGHRDSPCDPEWSAMAMAEGYACESACGGLPSNPQHNFSARMPFESPLKCLASLLERQHGVHESA